MPRKKFSMSKIILILLFFAEFDKSASENWDYGVHQSHVQNWPRVCKSGKLQSPIDIDTTEVQSNEGSIESFLFDGYNKRMFGEMSVLKNTGHTIKLGFDTNEHASNITPSIEGGGLTNAKYFFLNAHLHWGATNDQGSEHTFDGKHSPMELHLVHWNSGLGESPGEAIATGSYDALAVLSIHFKIGNENEKLDSFFTNVDRVIKQSTKAVLRKGVKLEQFLPENKESFYRYNGSLTTPTCDEIVIWTIFKEKIEISQDQMNVLRQITYKHYDMDKDEDLSNNFRPAQDLNGRIVVQYGKTTDFFEEETSSVVIAGFRSGYLQSSAVESKSKYQVFQTFMFIFVQIFLRQINYDLMK